MSTANTPARIIQIGLGQMGLALAQRTIAVGYEVVGFDISPLARDQAAAVGIATHPQLGDVFGSAPQKPRVIVLCIPEEHIDNLLIDLRELVSSGDIIVDMSNSFFMQSARRQQLCKDTGVHFIDCGVLGSASRLTAGPVLMLGGEINGVQLAESILRSIAKDEGVTHVGGPGAGHFAKMIHTAIEYGMMGAIAEGFYMLEEHAQALDLQIDKVFRPYGEGNIIRSQLMQWLQTTYSNDPSLQTLQHSVAPEHADMDMEYLTDHEPARILDAAVIQRKLTRLEPSRMGAILNAMRVHFGNDLKRSQDEHKQTDEEV